MKSKIEVSAMVLGLLVACILAFLIGLASGGAIERNSRPNSIRVSQASILEINMACGGDYRDLAVNRQFVYANCVRRGPRFDQPGIHEYVEPVTVQNYKMKQ